MPPFRSLRTASVAVLAASLGLAGTLAGAAGPAAAATAVVPTVVITSPLAEKTVLTGGITVTWTASPGTGGTAIAFSSVRVRRSIRSLPFGSYVEPTAWQHLTGRALTTSLSMGITYCFSVRVTNSDSPTPTSSPWTADRCVSTPVDDRALVASSSSIVRGTNAAYYAGTYTLLAKSSYYVGLANITARGITVVGTTCPSCGALVVYLGGVKIGTVNFAFSTTATKQLRPLVIPGAGRSGTLILVNRSGKPVFLDGVTVRRPPATA